MKKALLNVTYRFQWPQVPYSFKESENWNTRFFATFKHRITSLSKASMSLPKTDVQVSRGVNLCGIEILIYKLVQKQLILM